MLQSTGQGFAAIENEKIDNAITTITGRVVIDCKQSLVSNCVEIYELSAVLLAFISYYLLAVNLFILAITARGRGWDPRAQGKGKSSKWQLRAHSRNESQLKLRFY